MLKAINKLFLTVFLLFAYGSCKLINFVDITVCASVKENQRYFCDDYICLDFSYMPDYISVENLVNLKKDNSTISIDIEWNNKQCKIKPSDNWELGMKYQLIIDGDIRTSEAGIQYLYLNRHFIYGKESELFSLISCSAAENSILDKNQTVIFEFSKPVNQVSFNAEFRISPSVDIEKKFEGNKVYVSPVSKWPINTYFNWTINSILSADSYILDKEYTGKFRSEEDLILPEIESVSRVSIYDGDYTWLDENLNNILIGNGIGFIFSKSMDYSSVSNAISFNPSLRGNLILVPDSDNKKFVYVPSANFKINTDYKLIVSNSCKDINSLALKSDYIALFRNANEYLKVTSIVEEHYTADMKDIELYGGDSADTIGTLRLPSDYEADSTVNVHITFSKAISKSLRSAATNAVSFSLLFPAKYNSIKVNSVKWNSLGDKVIFALSNFSIGTAETPVYYQISITGGENGVINSAGEYMEENLCITFRTYSE